MAVSRPTAGRPLLVVVFVPMSRGLERGARWSLQLSLGAATGLLVGARGLWRVSERARRAERALEHRRRLALVGEMSAVMAHELRNPLASLKGHAQLLAEGLPSSSPRS